MNKSASTAVFSFAGLFSNAALRFARLAAAFALGLSGLRGSRPAVWGGRRSRQAGLRPVRGREVLAPEIPAPARAAGLGVAPALAPAHSALPAAHAEAPGARSRARRACAASACRTAPAQPLPGDALFCGAGPRSARAVLQHCRVDGTRFRLQNLISVSFKEEGYLRLLTIHE